MPAGPGRLPTRVSPLQEHTTPALICLATGPSQTKARPEIAEKDWVFASQELKIKLVYPGFSVHFFALTEKQSN